MSDYRLYMMTGDGHIAGVHQFRSLSEEIAILTADRFRQQAAAELWNLRRRIKIFRPDEIPTGPTIPRSRQHSSE